jgi:hypothetical protein
MTTAQQIGKGSSYYQMITIRTPDGESRHRVDRDLAKTVLDAQAGQGDGRIGMGDLASIAAKITDGGRYGAGEKAIVRALLAATDDRAKVEINGQRIRITDPAEKEFVHQMFSFFGKLGAKAKQSDVQQAGQALQQFAQQLSAQQA